MKPLLFPYTTVVSHNQKKNYGSEQAYNRLMKEKENVTSMCLKSSNAIYVLLSRRYPRIIKNTSMKFVSIDWGIKICVKLPYMLIRSVRNIFDFEHKFIS